MEHLPLELQMYPVQYIQTSSDSEVYISARPDIPKTFLWQTLHIVTCMSLKANVKSFGRTLRGRWGVAEGDGSLSACRLVTCIFWSASLDSLWLVLL